jgi:hypothetical protein
MTNIGWTNAIPDGEASVYVEQVGRSRSAQVNITAGYGYHDHMWSNQSFERSVKHWYKGHGRAGRYSFVWLYSEDYKGQTYSNIAVSELGGSDHVASSNSHKPGEKKPLTIHVDKDSMMLELHIPGFPRFGDINVQKTRVSRWHYGKVSDSLALDTKGSLKAWIMNKIQFSIPDYMFVPILSLFAPTEIVNHLVL